MLTVLYWLRRADALWGRGAPTEVGDDRHKHGLCLICVGLSCQDRPATSGQEGRSRWRTLKPLGCPERAGHPEECRLAG